MDINKETSGNFFSQEKEDILETYLGDELILMHFQTGECYILNHNAQLLWSLLDTPRSIQTVFEAFIRENNALSLQFKTDISLWFSLALDKKIISMTSNTQLICNTNLKISHQVINDYRLTEVPSIGSYSLLKNVAGGTDDVQESVADGVLFS